ncbi:hypothetical protein BU17DRAFT_96375 [Hysterangium stoloniferum]|nr:hypothetical protein BU17DRAFT_96375 [Hysterangium stoloniferum]
MLDLRQDTHNDTIPLQHHILAAFQRQYYSSLHLSNDFATFYFDNYYNQSQSLFRKMLLEIITYIITFCFIAVLSEVDGDPRKKQREVALERRDAFYGLLVVGNIVYLMTPILVRSDSLTSTSSSFWKKNPLEFSRYWHSLNHIFLEIHFPSFLSYPLWNHKCPEAPLSRCTPSLTPRLDFETLSALTTLQYYAIGGDLTPWRLLALSVESLEIVLDFVPPPDERLLLPRLRTLGGHLLSGILLPGCFCSYPWPDNAPPINKITLTDADDSPNTYFHVLSVIQLFDATSLMFVYLRYRGLAFTTTTSTTSPSSGTTSPTSAFIRAASTILSWRHCLIAGRKTSYPDWDDYLDLRDCLNELGVRDRTVTDDHQHMFEGGQCGYQRGFAHEGEAESEPVKGGLAFVSLSSLEDMG